MDSNGSANGLHKDDESEDFTTSTPSVSVESPMQRDEVQEVRNQSRKETEFIRFWRLVVALVHISVATVVTVTTYYFLKEAEEETFKTAFDQFSRSVANAATQHQESIRDSFTGLHEAILASAMATNATWPFFSVPYWEALASHARKQSRSETLTCLHFMHPDEVEEWQNYTAANHEHWVKESHMLVSGNLDRLQSKDSFIPQLHGGRPNIGIVPRDDYYLVAWQSSPPPFSYGLINWESRTNPDYNVNVQALMSLPGELMYSRVRDYTVSIGASVSKDEHEAMHSGGSSVNHPHAWVAGLIYEQIRDITSKPVALCVETMALDASLRNLLPSNVELTAVISNSCNQTFTYSIQGKEAIFLGEDDLHDKKYDDKHFSVFLFDGLYRNPEFLTTKGHCMYYMDIYPSSKLEDQYVGNTPAVFAAVVATTFVLVAVVFMVYDIFVQKRNEKMVASAARSSAVVTSMFPAQYRDSMMEQMSSGVSRNGVQTFSLTPGKGSSTGGRSKPLADLFLDCTVLFADIAGFTAWSSVREPHQVFTLLETVYGAFDSVAKRRGIFKVETVGDCYVAAAGLPTPRSDHATAMCRFARDIMNGMDTLMSNLVVTTGPDTGELTIRVGIHSGPVTAGVLRGERARFQLFGDTVNTASRIESTSKAGRVQISVATVEWLRKAGKARWAVKREDRILAKGKGELETYWLLIQNSRNIRAGVDQPVHNTTLVASRSDSENLADEFNRRTEKLIEWNVDVLGRLLCAVVARRSGQSARVSLMRSRASGTQEAAQSSFLDEVVEIIHLPEFDQKTARLQLDPELVELPHNVVEQLRHYVATIANMYRMNPFHSFEHASHVVMSVNKLMSRIVAPSLPDLEDPNVGGDSNGLATRQEAAAVAATLHDHTYGITSDPLTQFSCALSALIHDVDHQGVTNAQLVQEHNEVATMYDDRSPAEQNSLALAWELLKEKSYSDLRATIYASDAERKRFRQLLVNSVMATDIADKELKVLRNNRWDKAFFKGDEESFSESRRDAVNRKATIVIEHLIQASDVSHTMQHWHIYRRWNENFFRECYKAFRDGRAAVDPSENWYKGEIGFFDFYIIPLAKKLKECGVFGKSSGEFLNYATENRNEWEQRGASITKEMKRKADEDYMNTANQHDDELAYYSDEEIDPHTRVFRRDSSEGRP